ncbi:MAG: TIGR03618 family F420-dependent PPOX class oxidoreductase [Acidimicrobiales bacterium]
MLDQTVKDLAKGRNFAALTTLQSNGQPVTQIMWVDCDDDHVLVNTETHRRKFDHVQKDPRVAITIWDSSNPYHYSEVRGRVVEMVRGPEARSHIDELSQKYNSGPYANPIQSERVILRIAPDRQRSQ